MTNLPLTNLPFYGVICGTLNYTAVLVSPNIIAGVQFGFAQHIHGE